MGFQEKDSPSGLANSALGDYYFQTIIESGLMFYYDKLAGIWKPHGDKLIRTALRKRYPSILTIDEREVIRFIEDTTYTRSDNFQPNPDFIALKNGELCLRTQEFEGGFDPTHNIRNKFDIVYEPRRRCPNFMKFLKEVLPDPQDRLTVLECLALVLVPWINFERACMFIGDGANGKSTLFNIFKAILGKNSFCAISIHSLIYNRFSAAELDGRVANVYPDINSEKIKELDRFKMIVSGETMTVEHKNGQPYQIDPVAVHYFSANKPPEIQEETDAVFRRFIMVEFPVSFLDNKKLDLTEELVFEKQGVFNLLLKVARCLNKRKKFTFEQSVSDLRLRWHRKSNTIYEFIHSDIVLKGAQYSVSKTALYERYVKYCLENNYVVKQQREFTIQVQKFGYTETRTTKIRSWGGLGMIDEGQEKL